VSINLMGIHHEILGSLAKGKATFAQPLSSDLLGKLLNVTPSYVRERMQLLISLGLVGVRHGRGGGYYIISRTKKGKRAHIQRITEEAKKKAGLAWGKYSW
jgi:DNA-binding IscR family transcriptional regulator